MKTWFAALLVIVLSGVPCATSAREVRVVASFTVLADMAKQIGGGLVQVRSLVGPNGDPHVYEPTPQDAEALARADVIVVNGLGLEGWMDRLVRTSDTRGTVIVATTGIRTRLMHENGRDVPDPHAWNSAIDAIVYVGNIVRALAGADPAHAAEYRAAGSAYEARLRELDRWARRGIGSVPAVRRIVITNHDAFGYLGAAYGIRFLAPVGLSTESEASAATVAHLIDQIRRTQVHAVFLENSGDPRLTEQIAAETGVKPDGTLFPEALSAADGPAPTYVRMFRYNFQTLLHGMRAP